MPPVKRPREPAIPASAAQSTAASGSGKRVKFAGGDPSTAPAAAGGDDDFDLEEAPTKKGDVVTDGYDSDSSAGSDGGFGVGGGREGAAGRDGGKDDEDDDMFGDGDEKKDDKKGKGKTKEFLEMGDIEGQEFGKEGSDGEEEDGDDLEEDYEEVDDLANDDEAPRSRRSKKGMGFQLSSFNMQDELNEGRFSADGSYVQNKEDPLATHDAWLDGVSKKAIKAAKDSKARMEEEQRRREEAETKGGEKLTQERDDCLIGLLALVREGETVAAALSRLGSMKKKGPKSYKKSRSASGGGESMEVDDDTATRPTTTRSTSGSADFDPLSKKINLLTHLSSTLLSTHGELEIYDQTYEDILKTLKSEGAVRRDWVPQKDPDIEAIEADFAAHQREEAEAAAAASGSSGRRTLIARPAATPSATALAQKYLYKWKNPPPGQPEDKEYGPYSRAELESWVAGGYFGPAGLNIDVKVEGTSVWTTWTKASV